ncbi:MAG: FKBP-type peptidyl-prolyl cis-trans isomerase, partial [Flavobacteriales bacterium]|nr:FKBP-type peptidyl-prolyl cis-trans isomerase [Flavobacteriales bacterium]
IKIHFVGKLSGGDKFASSRDRDRPIVFTVGIGQVIKGWDEIFTKLTVGTHARVEIPAELAYGEKGLAKVPPNSDLVYYVELIEILDPPIPYDVNQRDTFKLESGLQYLIAESSTGRKAESFRTVTVNYTGYLDDGNIFDSSVEKGFPFEFVLGKGMVIAGWEEGILHMREGEKFRFIIPPSIAYGKKGFSPVIPANATLIYDVELMRID